MTGRRRKRVGWFARILRFVEGLPVPVTAGWRKYKTDDELDIDDVPRHASLPKSEIPARERRQAAERERARRASRH